VKRFYSVLIIFTLFIITLFNYNILKFSKKDLVYPKFIAQDRPFGENMASMPIRNCIAMLNSIDLSSILNNKREESNKYSNEELCRLGNLESFITFGDLDGDFLSEVMLVDNRGKISLYWNMGSSYKRDNFLSDNLSKFAYSEAGKGVFFFMDANNDNLNDIILSPNSNRNNLLIFSNKGERRIDVERPISYQGEFFINQVPTNVTTDDINKDGLADIIFTISGNDNYPVRIFTSNIDKEISYIEETSKFFNSNDTDKKLNIANNTTLVSDFNYDGSLDLFVSGVDSSNFYFYKDDKFIFDDDASIEVGLIGASLSDYNKDGLLDIIATNSKDANKGLVVFLATKNNISKNIISIYDKRLKNATGFADVDINLDGYSDFFIGSQVFHNKDGNYMENNLLRPYLLLGDDRSYKDEAGEIFRSLLMIEPTAIIASTDFNGDFKPDILLASDEMTKPHLIVNSTQNLYNSASVIIKGIGLGGSPLNGEGAIITVKIKDRPVQKFKLPSKISNYNVYSATAPIIIGLGNNDKAQVEVIFPSGKIIKGMILKDMINIIKEAE